MAGVVTGGVSLGVGGRITGPALIGCEIRMVDQRYQPESPMPPRSCVLGSVLLGGVLFAARGAWAGYAGVCVMEYQVGPQAQAALVSFNVAPYGLLAGLIVGLFANRRRYRRWARKQLLSPKVQQHPAEPTGLPDRPHD
jgi:hypothetical protein